MKYITCLELTQLPLSSSEVVIDLRSKYEFKKGHFEGSINIIYELLITNYQKYLNKKTKYYLICNSGKLSIKAASFLTPLGYNVYSVIGGYDAWI